jgi:hypothetical protein
MALARVVLFASPWSVSHSSGFFEEEMATEAVQVTLLFWGGCRSGGAAGGIPLF